MITTNKHIFHIRGGDCTSGVLLNRVESTCKMSFRHYFRCKLYRVHGLIFGNDFKNSCSRDIHFKDTPVCLGRMF